MAEGGLGGSYLPQGYQSENEPYSANGVRTYNIYIYIYTYIYIYIYIYDLLLKNIDMSSNKSLVTRVFWNRKKLKDLNELNAIKDQEIKCQFFLEIGLF